MWGEGYTVSKYHIYSDTCSEEDEVVGEMSNLRNIDVISSP